MKLYTVYTDSHKILFENYFKPSVDSSFEIISIKQDIEGDGAYCSNGYMTSLVDKTKEVVKSIVDNYSDVIAWSDCDVMLNGLTSEILLSDLEKTDKHIAFSMLEVGGDACFGFHVMRCNEITKWLWDNILKRSIERPNEYDQVIGHHFMRENKFEPGYLGEEYYNMCFNKKPVEHPKIIHAACCTGVDNKIHFFERFKNGQWP